MVEAKDVIGGVAILGGLALGFMLLTKSRTPRYPTAAAPAGFPFDIGSFLGGNDTNPLLDFIKSAQEQQNTQGAPAGTKKAASLSDVNDYLTQYFGQPIASYAGSMGDIETLRPLPGYNQGAASAQSRRPAWKAALEISASPAVAWPPSPRPMPPTSRPCKPPGSLAIPPLSPAVARPAVAAPATRPAITAGPMRPKRPLARPSP